MKEVLNEIDNQLYEWGDWVRSEVVNPGYGNSAISRIDKAETRFKKSRRRAEKTDTVIINYSNNQAVSASFSADNVSIPVDYVHCKATKSSFNAKKAEKCDEIGLEIDKYLAELKINQPFLRKFVKFRWQLNFTRDETLKELKISKDEYYATRLTVCMYIYVSRVKKMAGMVA